MNDKNAHIHPGNKFNIGEHILYRNGNSEFEVVAIHIYTNLIQYDIAVSTTVMRHVDEDQMKEC